MANSQSYVDFVLEQLERVAAVTSRRMFGALGVYCDGRFFAIVDDDTLFFKVDDSNRQEYLDAGMPAFMPDGSKPMGYYQVPADVLEDDRRLGEWMRSSVAVAEAAEAPKKRKS